MKTRAQAKIDLMEVDEPSYDILEWFPILYCQNVFKYLDGKDVIQASAVNKEWRKFSGESQQMKKVKLMFNGWNLQKLNRTSVNMIKKSQRKYENIEFRNISDRFLKYIPEVLEHRAGSWKSVKMINCDGLSLEMWTELFKIIEPSVEELSFTAMYGLPQPVDADPQWTFPYLKELEGQEINLWSAELVKPFTHCTSLVKFHWKNCASDPTEAKLTILRNNHNLKDLAVTTFGISLENFVDFKFKLKKLCLFRSMFGHASTDIVFSFLETQAQTLESLELDNRFNRDCLKLILNMPRLTSFATSYNQLKAAFPHGARPLPGNTTIAHLELKDAFFGQPQRLFAAFFRALTSLKHFKCGQIDDQMFLALAQVVPALESFEAKYFDVSRFPDFDIFPDMKLFKVQMFWQHLPEATGDGNFASLARAEMRKIR